MNATTLGLPPKEPVKGDSLELTTNVGRATLAEVRTNREGSVTFPISSAIMRYEIPWLELDWPIEWGLFLVDPHL